MPPYTCFPDLDDLAPEVPADSILSRTIYEDEHLKAILFSFAAGQELSEHTSTYLAILHFLKGEAHISLGGDAMEATAGTWVRMEPRLPHSIVARTPVTMLLLMFKTPDTSA